MAQAVSRHPLTAGVRDVSQTSPRDICGGRSGIGTDYCRSISIFPRQYHSTINLLKPSGNFT
jgi:hypothetical protein